MPMRDGMGPRWGGGPGAGWGQGRFCGACGYGPRVTKKDYLEELKKQREAVDEEIKDLEKNV